ncbi:MAG: hypothetical protein AAGD33_06750 [Actinomycetota bacterium]
MLAAFLQSSLVRLIPVGMVVLAIQRTIVVDLPVADVIIQFVLAFVATAGAVGGSERGAIAGFVLGLMVDLVGGTPIGSTAIAFTVAGAVAGLLALLVADPQWWLVAAFTGIGAAVGEAMLPVVRLFVGQENPWPPEMLKIVVVVAVAAMVLSPLLAPIARWSLRLRRAEWDASRAEETVT